MMQADLAAVIRNNAQRLDPPAGIDATRLLWALAGNESGFGANPTPRHEDSYCPNHNGVYAPNIKSLTALWGCWAHCSYGPWQIMFDNTMDLTPMQLDGDPNAAIGEVIAFLNYYVFGHLQAKTLQDIANAYNDGHILPADQQWNAYALELAKNYSWPMPS